MLLTVCSGRQPGPFFSIQPERDTWQVFVGTAESRIQHRERRRALSLKVTLMYVDLCLLRVSWVFVLFVQQLITADTEPMWFPSNVCPHQDPSACKSSGNANNNVLKEGNKRTDDRLGHVHTGCVKVRATGFVAPGYVLSEY